MAATGDTIGPTVTVAAYQGPAELGNVSANLATVQAVARDAASKGVELVVFPELFLSGYGMEDYRPAAQTPTTGAMAEVGKTAASVGIALCVPYVELGEDGNLYNSAAVYGRDGVLAFNYRKVHTYKKWEAAFTAGDPKQLATFGLPGSPFRYSVLICYDIEFPEGARVNLLHGADVLLVPTALCRGPCEKVIPLCVVPTRALENHLLVVYSNLLSTERDAYKFCGRSAIVGPGGLDMARADDATAELLVAKYVRSEFESDFVRNTYTQDRRPECYGKLVDTA